MEFNEAAGMARQMQRSLKAFEQVEGVLKAAANAEQAAREALSRKAALDQESAEASGRLVEKREELEHLLEQIANAKAQGKVIRDRVGEEVKAAHSEADAAKVKVSADFDTWSAHMAEKSAAAEADYLEQCAEQEADKEKLAAEHVALQASIAHLKAGIAALGG